MELEHTCCHSLRCRCNSRRTPANRKGHLLPSHLRLKTPRPATSTTQFVLNFCLHQDQKSGKWFYTRMCAHNTRWLLRLGWAGAHKGVFVLNFWSRSFKRTFSELESIVCWGSWIAGSFTIKNWKWRFQNVDWGQRQTGRTEKRLWECTETRTRATAFTFVSKYCLQQQSQALWDRKTVHSVLRPEF